MQPSATTKIRLEKTNVNSKHNFMVETNNILLKYIASCNIDNDHSVILNLANVL